MARPVTCFFGQKPCYWPGENFYTLELGVAPSRGVATLREQDARDLVAGDGHTFEFTDQDDNQIQIESLFVERIENAAPARDEQLVAVHFADERVLSEGVTISGQFNTLREDQQTYIAKSINAGNPFTWDELAQKCLDALGWDVTAQTGITWIPPNVSWELAPATAALEALLREVGWDIAFQPDASFELIDLGDSSASFAPGGTVVSHLVKADDKAVKKPAKVRVGVRVFREKELIFEPVMQHDGAGTFGRSTSARAGEWFPIASVLSDWNTSVAQVKQFFYSHKASSRAPDKLIAKLGAEERGKRRLNLILAQAYRCFRLKDTQRETFLPLQKVRAQVGTQTGLVDYLGASASDQTTYHRLTRDNAGIDYFRGIANQPALETLIGRPPFPVIIRDAREGVIEFRSANRPITGVIRRTLGTAETDFDLDPQTVRVTVGFWKKFETNPDDVYHIVTRTLAGTTNGKTKTFLISQPYLREVFSSGSFVAQNTTDVNTAINGFLDAWERRFDAPDPEEWLIAGVQSGDTLDGAVWSIHWQAGGQGMTTRYRVFDRFSANPNAERPDARAQRISVTAERVSLVTPSAVGGRASGGGGGGGDLGSLSNESVLTKAPDEQREPGEGAIEPIRGFLNDMSAWLLVAEDWTMDPSGENPCEGGSPTTQSPRTSRKGVTTKSPAGKPVVSGGPADKPG